MKIVPPTIIKSKSNLSSGEKRARKILGWVGFILLCSPVYLLNDWSMELLGIESTALSLTLVVMTIGIVCLMSMPSNGNKDQIMMDSVLYSNPKAFAPVRSKRLFFLKNYRKSLPWIFLFGSLVYATIVLTEGCRITQVPGSWDMAPRGN